jgi:hypothetical protein
MIPVAAELDDAVRSFAALVGLILTLITLFTGARDSTVRTLEGAALTDTSKAQLKTEAILCLGLFAVTLALFAVGLPLWVRTLAHRSWSTDHSVRWAFAIVWPLLLPLGVWQLRIHGRALERAKDA